MVTFYDFLKIWLVPKLATDSLSQIRLFRQKKTGLSQFGSQYLN